MDNLPENIEPVPMPEESALTQPVEPAAAETPASVVNVINPNGELVGLPHDQVPDALQSGYSIASPEDINHARYSTPMARMNVAASSLADTITFGGATGLKRMLGATPEELQDLQHAKEDNPFENIAGQIGGLMTPFGAGAAITKAGKLAGGLFASKIASGAARLATESALLAGADETSKAFAGDPNQTAETAMTNISLSGLFGGGLGGGFGAASKLWNATMGGRVNTILHAVNDKLAGKTGAISDDVVKAMDISGLDIAPEIRAATSNDPFVKNLASTLEQTDTTQGGRDFQKAITDARSKASKGIVESLGRTEEDIAQIKNQSDFQAGQNLQNQISKEFKSVSDPIAKSYDEIQSKFKGALVPDETKALMQESLAKAEDANGWKLLPDSDELKLSRQVSGGLNNVKTLEDMRQLQSNVGAKAVRDGLWGAKKEIDSILANGRETILNQAFEGEAPELSAKFKVTQSAYRDLMGQVDELNSRLKVGNPSGPKDFLFKLGEQNPEVTLSRLGRTNDAGLLQFLSEKFPQTAAAMKNFHIDSILDKASQAGEVNSSKVLKAISNMSPELRAFALPEGSMPRITAIETFLNALKDSTHNFSNSARAAEKLFSWMPGSALGMASWLSGHNPALGFLLQPLAKYIGKDVPDAIRLSMLKFIGSSAPIEAQGFKTAVDFIAHAARGEGLINKATKSLFRAGSDVIPLQMRPDEKKLNKLDKRLQDIQVKPEQLFNIGGKTAHYLPEHGSALAQTGANAANYLNKLRPSEDKHAPLDSDVKTSSTAKANYQNALRIANQPLTVLEKLKDGTLNSQDVLHLRNLYPALYEKLSTKITHEMIETIHNGETIPYRTRMSLSLFLGQPLDSTMTPQGIQSSQASLMTPPTPQQQQGMRKPALNSFKQITNMEQTPLQNRLGERSSR